MSTDDILKYIEYLAMSIDISLNKYQNAEDFKDFEFLKIEIVYIYNIYKEKFSLASIDRKRFTAFLAKLDSLFDKYLIDAFDYYGGILEVRYNDDVHAEYVKNLRKKNRRKRENENVKK